MQYLITFLEGIISFISPCMLPMLPLYLSYFGGTGGKKQKIGSSAIGFVLGFSLVFCLLGLFAGTLGAALRTYKTVLDIVCGTLIVLFGLSYLEVLHIPFFKGMQSKKINGGIFSAFLFGMVYSLSLTPCVGAFLGSALMLASSTGGALEGVLLLLCYSLGLGIPFILAAVLLEQLGSAFAWIKRHYRVINFVCGIFLILIGILTALGVLNKLLAAMA